MKDKELYKQMCEWLDEKECTVGWNNSLEINMQMCLMEKAEELLYCLLANQSELAEKEND